MTSPFNRSLETGRLHMMGSRQDHGAGSSNHQQEIIRNTERDQGGSRQDPGAGRPNNHGHSGIRREAGNAIPEDGSRQDPGVARSSSHHHEQPQTAVRRSQRVTKGIPAERFMFDDTRQSVRFRKSVASTSSKASSIKKRDLEVEKNEALLHHQERGSEIAKDLKIAELELRKIEKQLEKLLSKDDLTDEEVAKKDELIEKQSRLDTEVELKKMDLLKYDKSSKIQVDLILSRHQAELERVDSDEDLGSLDGEEPASGDRVPSWVAGLEGGTTQGNEVEQIDDTPTFSNNMDRYRPPSPAGTFTIGAGATENVRDSGNGHNFLRGQPGYEPQFLPPLQQQPVGFNPSVPPPTFQNCLPPSCHAMSYPATMPPTQQPQSGVDQLVTALGRAFGSQQKHRELPFFGGKPEEWLTFKSHFLRNAHPDDAINLDRIRKALKGEAYEAVKCLFSCPSNVNQIMLTLEMEFGRPELIIENLIQQAEFSKNPDIAKPETIVEYARVVETLVVSIRGHGQYDYMNNIYLLNKLVEKLPNSLKREWMLHLRSDPRRVKNLQTFQEWISFQKSMAVEMVKPKPIQAQDVKKAIHHREKRGQGTMHIITTDEDEDKPKPAPCSLCKKTNHNLVKCFKFKEMSMDDRWKHVRESKLCFTCLVGRHQLKDCKIEKKQCSARGCPHKHHILLHADTKKSKEVGCSSGTANEAAPVAVANENQITVIRTASSKPVSIVPVIVEGPKSRIHTYALLDSGASFTAIDEGLATRLGLEGRKFSHSYTGVRGQEHTEEATEVKVVIMGTRRNAEKYVLEKAITMNGIGAQPYSLNVADVKKKWPYLRRAQLRNMSQVVPEVVIGEDNPYLSLHREFLARGQHEPIAKRTILGWTIGGHQNANGESPMSSMNIFTEFNSCHLDKLIKDGFSLEAFGVVPRPNKGSIEDQRAMKILEDTAKLNGGRWECGLLWRHDNVQMPESKAVALHRLSCLERKMNKDADYAQLYRSKIDEYMRKGFIRKLSSSEAEEVTERTWYIPHFGVYNVNKPGKIRLVFDAAAESNGKRLNDFLLTGPDLNRPLLTVLWNFRRHNVAIMGDIEDMYHRILTKKEDRSAQRFLWKEKDGSITTFEMQVMIFGATSSPTSAIFIKNKNAERFREDFPEAVEAIQQDFYVDDCESGSTSIHGAIQLRKEITDINAAGGMVIKKWMSNSQAVIDSIPEDYRAAGAKDFGADKSTTATERVLGMWWDPQNDEFTFKVNFHKVDPEILGGRHPTKREVSSLIMSVFDPIGFLGNFKIKGMILLQLTWKAGVGWDEPIPDSVFEEWQKWVEILKEIVEVKVPRLYCFDIDGTKDIQLHVFVDASEEAYSTVAYFRIACGGVVKVAFVSSKVRVATLKKLTIPRLELLAAVLGSRLATTICREVKIKLSSRCFWSDSKTVLHWIRSETMRYREWVANRIGEIQENTSPSEWRWIPTGLNVADEATRLKSEVELNTDSNWLQGPLFLREDPAKWPMQHWTDETHCNEEVKNAIFTLSSIPMSCLAENKQDFIQIDNFSTYYRLARVAGGVIAAFQFWKFKVLGGMLEKLHPWRRIACRKSLTHVTCFGCIQSCLSSELFEKGEVLLLRQVQMQSFRIELEMLKKGGVKKSSTLYKLQPFVDSDGLLKVKGRLPESQGYHPIIMPSYHHLTALIIMEEHCRNGHQGRSTTLSNLRQRFWIIGAYSAVRRTIAGCMTCRLLFSRPIVPEMGSLPHFRLAAHQHPFTFTGVDFFGPLQVTVARHHEKRWIALFTCLVTRAIHLEVAQGLSTDDMMMILSRFMDCRGRPHHIYSDNATNFVGAGKELRTLLNSVDWKEVVYSKMFSPTQWHFQPPAAPHMSGVWERLVQSVKKVLKSTLFEKFPKDQTLLTIIKGAENIVNSRPLTYVSSDPDDPENLTPNHFLRGFCDIGPALPWTENAGDVAREQWKKCQVTLDQMWSRWQKEYLPTLLLREKWYQPQEPLQVGEIVLVVDDLQPRNCWKRAVITQTFPSREDGQVRVVEVTTRRDGKEDSVKKRPVTKICPLGLKMEFPPTGALAKIGGRNVVVEGKKKKK